MTRDTAQAKTLLQTGEHTCVLVKDSAVLTSSQRGVRPLLDWLESMPVPCGYAAADKVVGKAAAYLYVLLGVTELYADVISQASLAVLEEYGIPVIYGTSVPAIRNRTDTGFCPLEQAVLAIDSPTEALTAIRETLAALAAASNPR